MGRHARRTPLERHARRSRARHRRSAARQPGRDPRRRRDRRSRRAARAGRGRRDRSGLVPGRVACATPRGTGRPYHEDGGTGRRPPCAAPTEVRAAAAPLRPSRHAFAAAVRVMSTSASSSRLRVLLVTDTDKPIGELRRCARAPRLRDAERRRDARAAGRRRGATSRRRDHRYRFAIARHARAACRDARHRAAPVLMFSHDANQSLIRAAVGAGVSAYLVEGLSAERLAPILEVALARARRRAASPAGRRRARPRSAS